jgi:hypothetical protein
LSIKQHIEDAEHLWQHGRKEGAWTQALIAAAATSRKRYPKPVPDHKAFKSFIKDVTPTLLFGVSCDHKFGAQLRFAKKPLEDIFYHELRCCLVHEAEMSRSIILAESQLDGDEALVAKLTVGDPNGIPDFWVLHLIKAIKEAPENTAEFPLSGHAGGVPLATRARGAAGGALRTWM